MKNFPKHVNTEQDFENLLKMPEFVAQTLKELKRIRDIEDSKIIKATTQKDLNNPESEWDTTEVTNPHPEWQRLGFKSKKELTDLILYVEVVKNGK